VLLPPSGTQQYPSSGPVKLTSQLKTFDVVFSSSAKHNCAATFLHLSFACTLTVMAKPKQPCPYFQRGTCRFGDACKYSHTTSPHDSGSAKKLPCHAFARGACKYGSQCKFSHDAPTSQENASGLDGKQSEQTTQPSGPTPYDKFVQWRYEIKREKRDINRAQPLGRRFAGFIQQALTLLDDANTMQEVITTLSNEGGLARLGEMLNADFALLEDDSLRNVFKSDLLPFLRIIAHDDVLSSSVLEGRLGTLLNYLYGVNGKRSVAVFTAAIRGLTYEELSEAEFEPCLISLSAVLEVNGSAQVNDDLRSSAETMIALANDCALSGNALKYYKKMYLRLGLGENISAAANKRKDDHTRQKPTFELLVDQPGDLSHQGPRHDNDFEDIDDIQILPTMGEILGDRAEYLPRSDPSTWHLEGAVGLLDRQFRLVREDTVGQLRDAARVETRRIQNPFEQTGASKHAGARTYSYRNVRLISAEMDPQKGLLCVFEFDQPRELANKSESQRKDWWAESSRLAPEALIMLLGSDQIAVFLTVLSATFPSDASKKSERSIEKIYPRAGDERKANVVVQLVNHTDADIKTVLFRFGLGYKESHKNLSFSLLEFPGVLLPAFKHTLEALQQMTLSKDLPFAELLAPTADSQHGTEVEAPAYTKRKGFSFDLSTLSTNHETITLDVSSPMDADVLSAQTTLDRAQAEALISTLCRSVCPIQGPPGTGKSYTGVALMKVLMENRKAAKLGPVLCVTFTNHALDQILEHLIDAGVEQVIRIGSRSKSERLSAVNLRAVAQKEPWTKLEGRERWMHKQNVDNFRLLVSEGLRELLDFSEVSVLTFLKDKHPSYHAQLVGPEIDEDGFELVQNKRAVVGLGPWLQGAPRSSPMPGGDRAQDIFSFSIAERQRLYYDWAEEILDPIQRSLLANLKAYEDAKAGVNKIRAEVDHRVLSGANVIGVTTSGLARNLDLLRRLNSKVLVVEEAGEVLEAHLLTAMLPSIEHAIMIGDHQQLRPKAQNYELSCENPRSEVKMDVSLFERLVHPNENENRAVQFVTLEVQRRMHPSISNLIRSTLYPGLQDSPEVAKYPEVSGMRHRLFWLDHREAEDKEKDRSDSTSHTNSYLRFAENMQSEQGKLIDTRSDVHLQYPGNIVLAQKRHVDVLSKLAGLGGRYRNLAYLRRKLRAFLKQTDAEEQPFSRVYDIVETLRRRRLADGHTIDAFEYDQTLLQTRGALLAMSLAIRCEIVAVVDFIAIYYAQPHNEGRSLTVDFSGDRDRCEMMVEEAESTKNILQQTEGHIFWAQLAGLECQVMESREIVGKSYDEIRALANTHLDSARELCGTHPGQTSSVVDEVREVRRLLDESGYQSQMRMVVAAMSKEFSGTGHWYRCANGHPFTIGECGMPMEATRCPQCGAPIGGQSHVPAAGVQSAGDIEREFGNLRVAE
jgi:hypothetical protein